MVEARLERWRRWIPAAVVAFCALLALGLLAIDQERGLGALLHLRDRVGDARAEVAALETRRAELVGRIHALRGEPLAVEQAARAALGMVRPDEIVVVLEPDGG